MSWLQNLAKKGENFLDQLDQQAGAAIEQAETKIKSAKQSAENEKQGITMERGSPSRGSPMGNGM